MIYKNEKRLSENKKFAFSLIEVLMALLIVSVLLVLMAPVITKKVTDKQSDGVVFTYDPNNQAISDLGCYFATINNYNSVMELYTPDETGCSEYSFVVPEGVHKINLTLVGGGGGGGGASGIEKDTEKTETIKQTVLEERNYPFSLSHVKKVTIDFLGVKGEDGATTSGITTSSSTGYIPMCSYGCNSGKGGKSSPATVNFDIPNELLRDNYKEILEKNSNLEKKHRARIKLDNSESWIALENETEGFGYNFRYGVKTEPENKYHYCGLGFTVGEITYINKYPNDTEFSICQLKEKNMVQPQEGQKTYEWDPYGDSFQVPLTVQGGEGGKIPGFEKYGYGGNGQGFTFNTNGVLSGSNLTPTTARADVMPFTTENGGPAYAQVTIHNEHFSAPGGGGAPGGAVRLISLPVNPGEEYIVRVGKGGTGGNAGMQKANGINGGSGYSTAFLRKNGDTETLMFIVNGGIGGQGGQAVEDNDDTKGKSAQHYSRFYSPTEFQNLVTMDKKISTITETHKGSLSSLIFNETLKYPAFTDNRVIGKLVYNITPGDILQTKNQNLLEQVSGSHLSTDGDGRGTITINGTSYNAIYDGLYYKTIVDNAAAFVGENGGFNGLSMKAGCGGLFAGNFDGRQYTSTQGKLNHHTEFVNKFIVQDTLYNVSDYYDNCTMETPDGQSANFVMPNPINKTYGQAGAGGGGGGYSLLKGPGKGGNGQNGYLMIDWKK